MDFVESDEDAAFRARARAFLKEHAPPPGDDDHSMFVVDEAAERDFGARGRAWQRGKYEHGWAGIDWPRAYGGAAGTSIQVGIFQEEEEKYASPWLSHNLGFGMAGGTLLRHGDEAQKQAHLPAMLRGDE